MWALTTSARNKISNLRIGEDIYACIRTLRNATTQALDIVTTNAIRTENALESRL